MTQSFSAFFLFSIAFCKDSWEDFTDLVEQMQMLDEFKGAYGGITLPSPPHPRIGHHPKTTAGVAAPPCLYRTSLPEQHIRTTASEALPSCSFVVFFICLFFNVLSPFLFFWFDVSVNSFVSVTFFIADYLASRISGYPFGWNTLVWPVFFGCLTAPPHSLADLTFLSHGFTSIHAKFLAL